MSCNLGVSHADFFFPTTTTIDPQRETAAQPNKLPYVPFRLFTINQGSHTFLYNNRIEERLTYISDEKISEKNFKHFAPYDNYLLA
jgi:hypothetical protein